jgi:hypothetical protein
MKETYLNNEIWTLTFGAAFQRANVYEKSATDDSKKQEFKQNTRAFIENKLIPIYKKGKVDETTHVKCITQLNDFTKAYQNILNVGKLNIGVSQKLLNLYLKYLWCLGRIDTPPHFPVDRRIQEILGFADIISWTKVTKVEDYMKIIDQSKKHLGKHKSLAELELNVYERRFNTDSK